MISTALTVPPALASQTLSTWSGAKKLGINPLSDLTSVQ